MAGEFEEPYNISIQTESLHSGSISFGRFETENLSWERRSSFSHNRYLEEVEKYSKPGSVTEKKAYFEAHFKKKGTRFPGSLESQSGRENCSENDTSENVGYGEEDDNINESSNYDHFDEVVLANADSTEYDGYGVDEFDHANSSSQYANFDESPDGSEYHGDYERMEYEREDSGVLSSESQKEAASDNDMVEHVFEEVMLQEPHQTETGYDDDEREEIGVNKDLSGVTANVEESITNNASPESGKAGTDPTITVPQQNLSPKSKSASKCGLKAQVNGSQVKRSNNNDASKQAAKKQNRRDKESPQRMKSETQSPQPAIPTRRSLLRTPKREDSEPHNSRSNLANKSASEKEPKLKKLAESQPCGSKKAELKTRQNATRLKQTACSANPDARISTAAFNFKCDERAERRKQFYTKLEEKMHAKEAEMTQIQAKTQEKTQAEIRQFRKSLNFKATPMPSFYSTAASPGSNGNKATSSKTKPGKVQQKSPGPGSKVATRSQLQFKLGNNEAISAGEPEKTVNLPESCGSSDSHVIELYEAGESLTVDNGSRSGKESEKVKEFNSQRHRTTENGKASKDQKVEGKPKMGSRRNSGEMVRKSIKGVGIGSSSGMGRVAVGVTS